jgi:uroporphyrinogen-III synthase
LFFCGDEHLEEWIFDLEEKNISVEKCVVYFKKLIPHLFKNIVGAMFFSPSQVEAFLLKNNLQKEIPVFSIGETTAETLMNKGFKNIFVAENKSEESVIEKVIEYFKK